MPDESKPSLKTLWEISGSGEVKINWPAVEAEANDGDMCGESGLWARVLMSVRAERDRLQVIVDTYPKARNGLSYVAEGMTSSTHDDWETPKDLFDALNAEFDFTLDVAATKHNTKCNRFYTKEDNGLRKPWAGRVWCNPPYGKGIQYWVERAYSQTVYGHADVVVLLIPARPDVSWWHDTVIKYAHDVRFLRGRLRFTRDGSKGRAPFPSAVVVFKKGK